MAYTLHSSQPFPSLPICPLLESRMDRKVRMNHSPLALSLVLVFLRCSKTLAQSPGPAPPGPANITQILEKAGQYTTFLRLMKITQVGDQINTQLNNSNQGMTVFAPPDNAFSGLRAGTLNTLSDQQKVALVQFHVLPTFLSMSQFQTVSNPLRTQAGNSGSGEFPLNVTTSSNQVNVSTGVIDATVANTVYSDGQLAVYQVDKVLLPLSLFGSPALAPSPLASNPKKKSGAADSSAATGDDGTADSSGAGGHAMHGMVSVGIVIFATIYLSRN